MLPTKNKLVPIILRFVRPARLLNSKNLLTAIYKRRFL